MQQTQRLSSNQVERWRQSWAKCTSELSGFWLAFRSTSCATSSCTPGFWGSAAPDISFALIDWISDALSQGYTNLQSLVKCLDHKNIVSDTVCSQAKIVLGCAMHRNALKCSAMHLGGHCYNRIDISFDRLAPSGLQCNLTMLTCPWPCIA